VDGNQAADQRMLVAMIERDGQVWFFKTVGPAPRIDRLRTAFGDFLRSVRFSTTRAERPSWQLPDGWVERAASGMRLATISIGSGPETTELTVSSLRQTDPDWNRYLLLNLNRWRGQLGLPPVSQSAVPELVKQIGDGDQKIYLADISAGSAPPTAPPRRQPAAASKGKRGFDTTAVDGTPPAGWQPDPITGMRKASFSLERDGQKIQLTVIPAGGGLLANVNRWRQQIGLAATSEAALAENVQAIRAGELNGKYVEFFGSREAILAAIFPAGGSQWFVKLKGDTELAKSVADQFKAFAEELQFKGR
jgi:hypothetical protein